MEHTKSYYQGFGLVATLVIAVLAVLGFILLTTEQTSRLEQVRQDQALYGVVAVSNEAPLVTTTSFLSDS